MARPRIRLAPTGRLFPVPAKQQKREVITTFSFAQLFQAKNRLSLAPTKTKRQGKVENISDLQMAEMILSVLSELGG